VLGSLVADWQEIGERTLICSQKLTFFSIPRQFETIQTATIQEQKLVYLESSIRDER
jgi:hypothetical protein